MNDNERLSKELRARAGQTGGHPISFDDVKRSAQKMRWQQRAAGAGVAAVVLAIAVPFGISVARQDTGAPPISGNPTDGVTPEPRPTTATASPREFRKVRLTANVERNSGEPRIPTLQLGRITLTDGSQITPEVTLQTFAPVGQGFIGLGPDAQGDWFVYTLDSAGKVTQKTRSGGYRLGVSPDGTQVAYSTADGRIVVVWDGGERELASNGATSVDIVGLRGSGACVDPETEVGNGCTVVWNDGERAMYSTEHGIVDRIPGFLSATGISVDGTVAGVVSLTDVGSCSAVKTLEGRQLWKTCDYTLGRFSPDGSYVIGKPAYLDGIGDGLVAVLDARTGAPLAEFDTADNAFINNTVWETNETLLTTLYDEGWALMRLSVDAEFSSSSTGRIPGDAESTPVFFVARA